MGLNYFRDVRMGHPGLRCQHGLHLGLRPTTVFASEFDGA